MLTTIWLSALATGMLLMTHYSTRPGRSEVEIDLLPASPSISHSGKATLWIYLHPHCPCSQATVRQLSRLLPIPDDIQVQFCCYQPSGSAPNWPDGSLWNAAERISSSQPFRDYAGVEANRFGVQTSGHVLLFDEQGNLCFSGGVTAGRGHEGDSAGWLKLEKMFSELADPECERLSFNLKERHTFQVYGCSIFAELN